MAMAASTIRCNKPRVQRRAVASKEPVVPAQVSVQKIKPVDSESGKAKIVLQPRLCTLRSYGSDRDGLIKTRRDGGGDEVSRFFDTLTEYIESSRKSQDFEIVSGRLAMVVFAATLTTEMVTGNSLFNKMELQGIVEAGGVCLAAMTFSASFAYFTIARNRVGRIFTIGCNSFIDSLIDQIIDGLFYESDSDEI